MATEKISGQFKEGDLLSERYKVLSLIRLGKAHSIYKVEQIFLKKTFALKTLATSKVGESAFRQFQIEAHSASKLSHPNLAKEHDLGSLEDGRPYYVMDLVEGRDLHEYSRQEGTLSVDDLLHIFIPISYALDYAHGEGIIHGDLKPSSIILVSSLAGQDYIPKILGFSGFQGATNTDYELQSKVSPEEMLRKALYISPEGSMGRRTDHRSDIYSLGCVMYEALTGAPPFHAETAQSLMLKHQQQKHPSLKEASMGRDYPPQLEAVISKALAKDANCRYQSFLDLANDLLAVRHPEALRKGEKAEVAELQPVEKIVIGDSGVNWKVVALFVGTNLLSITATCLLMTQFLHQETVSEKLSSDIHDYVSELATARSTFMTLVGSGASQKRAFHFPSVSIGKFSYFDARTARWIDLNARGEVMVPLNALTKFETEDRLIVERPNTLRLFGPDDISNLSIRATTLNSYEDNLAAVIDSAMAYISRYRSLHQLLMDRLPVTDVGVRCLQDLPNLVGLDINYSHATIESVKKLKNFRILTNLRIGGVIGAREIIPDLLNNPNLRVLGLAKTDLEDRDLELLGKIALHSLEIERNPKISDQGIHALCQNVQLLSLSMFGTAATPACIKDLAKFQNLSTICISVQNWTKADVLRLQSVLPKGCAIITYQPDTGSLGWHPVDWRSALK